MTSRSRWTQRRWTLLGIGVVALVPCFAVVTYIHRFAGFLPLTDQWDMPGKLFEARFEDDLRLEQFFVQHNEARKAFTATVWMLLAWNGWSVRTEMYVSVLLVGACALSYLLICRRAAPKSWLTPALIAATASVLLFHPAGLIGAHPAWLWGVNMENAVVVAVLVGAICANLYLRSWQFRYAISAACSAAATYSFSNGMLLWLLLYPRLYRSRGAEIGVPPRRTLWLDVAYLAGFALVVGSYFYGYYRPPHHPSLLVALESPSQILDFFFIWLGVPLSPRSSSLTVTYLLGVAAMGLYLSCLVEVARHKLWAHALPFLVLTTYTLASDVAVSLGRATLGPHVATSSRYILHVVIFYLGLNGLLWLCSTVAPGVRRRLFPRSALWVVLALQVASVANNWVGIYPKHIRAFHEHNQRGEAALRFVDLIPDNPDLKNLYRHIPGLVTRFRALQCDEVLDIELAPSHDELVLTNAGIDQQATLFISTSTQGEKLRVFGDLVDCPGIEGLTHLLLFTRAGAEEKFVCVLPLEVYPRAEGTNQRLIDAAIATDNIGSGFQVLELFGYDFVTQRCVSLGVTLELLFDGIATSEFLDATAIELRPQAGMFTVDVVSGVAVLGRTELTIPRGGPVVISGWAYDVEAVGPAARVYVKVGARLFPAQYGQLRPDVAKNRGRPEFMSTGFSCVLDEALLGAEASGAFKFVVETRRGEFLEDPRVLTIERADQ